MKKYVMLALATVFMIGMSVKAQDPKQNPPQDRNWQKAEMRHSPKQMLSAEKRADKMAQILGLSADEKVKVQALFEKQDLKRKEAFEKGQKMRDEMKLKFEAERKANDEELTKIIGPEKFKQLQDFKAQHEQKRMLKRQGNQPTPPTAPENK